MATESRTQKEREQVSDELQAAVADVRFRGQQKNYRVVLHGRVFTEVDMLAEGESQAMRLAEDWVRNKTQLEQVNAVDFDPHGWWAESAEEAPE